MCAVKIPKPKFKLYTLPVFFAGNPKPTYLTVEAISEAAAEEQIIRRYPTAIAIGISDGIHYED